MFPRGKLLHVGDVETLSNLTAIFANLDTQQPQRAKVVDSFLLQAQQTADSTMLHAKIHMA